MFLRFFDEGLAQASFLIACDRTGEAAVVDPRRDVDIYSAAARQHGVTIVYAIETHIHADFVSGARELAVRGVRPIAGPGAALAFPNHEARDGERLAIGDVGLQILHTPGHTPEHISVLVEAPRQPARLLTGDTLFVGAVGRPDLLGDDLMRRLAGDLYDSLQRILSLDDSVEVHPGHGSGSLCGSAIGQAPQSTLGQERRLNPMLQHRAKDPFVAAVLADLPETPPYFSRMKRINREGPPVLDLGRGVTPPPAMTARQAAGSVRDGAIVLDLRGSDSFAAGHVPQSINIGFGSRVGFWAGWVVPAGARLVLMTDDERQGIEARRQLLRVGLDAVEGIVAGGFQAWLADGLPSTSFEQITAQDLQDRQTRGEAVTVVDVRSVREWQSGHLAAAINVPVGDIPRRAAEIPRHAPVATICEGGFRSSLAASLLERAGVPSIANVAGGMAAFRGLELTR